LNRNLLSTSAADINGGFIDDAIKRTAKKGFCLESDFPSEDNSGGNYAQTLKEIDLQGRAYITLHIPSCEKMYSDVQKLIPTTTLNDLQEVINKSSENDFINNLKNRVCKNRIQSSPEVVSIQKTGFYNFFNDGISLAVPEKKYADEIDQQLSNKNPVGVSIDSKSFENRRFPASTPENAGIHAVVIAGRRFNEQTGQCEYKIRNSWGAGCSNYDKAYECKDGQFWMPKTDLVRRSWNLTYVK
jgi:hypothetical protein